MTLSFSGPSPLFRLCKRCGKSARMDAAPIDPICAQQEDAAPSCSARPINCRGCNDAKPGNLSQKFYVYLGEFFLGFIVDDVGLWSVVPINHAFFYPVLSDGAPRYATSRSTPSFLMAKDFYLMSVPEPCRSSIRFIEV